MADPMSGPITRCPWCSAELSPSDVEQCPSCGATLTSATGSEPEIRGVTTLDPEAILRARSDIPRPRNRILSFISGDASGSGDAAIDPSSVAPPSDEVRRVMLRLQLEAELHDLEAETIALKADVLTQRGIPLSQLAGPEEPGEAPAADPEAAAASDNIPDEPPPPGA